MSLTINETFQVAASSDRVFAFLTNPAEVVTCLPGAELTETIDERTYGGRVKVKVGPITSSYAGRATLVEVDAAQGRVKIVGEGKESGGPGSARMTMDGRVRALPGGGSEVQIDAVIDIVGRVMQFGRGLIESVSRQLFKQFVEAAQAKLGGAAPAASPNAAGDAGSVSAPAPSGRPPEAVGAAPVDAAPSAPASPATPGFAAASPSPVATSRELHALPLLWKVFMNWLRARFGRSR
jgi:uncharacterized protein